MPNDFHDYLIECRYQDRESDLRKALVLAIAMLLVLAFAIKLLAGPPPAFPPARSVRQICSGPERPEWCREYALDLEHGRKEESIAAMAEAATN